MTFSGFTEPPYRIRKIFGEFLAEGFGCFATNQQMGVGSELRRGSLSCPNRPHRFVGDHQFRRFLAGDGVKGTQALAAQHVLGEIGFAFFQYFADADDRP